MEKSNKLVCMKLQLKKSFKTHLWKLSKREFGHFNSMYKLNEKYENFREYLDTLYVYYINNLGLSVNLDGFPVEKERAQYMWAQLNKSFNNEPLYVWMYQKGDGNFGNISIGSRIVFDNEIAKKNTNNKTQSHERENYNHCTNGNIPLLLP